MPLLRRGAVVRRPTAAPLDPHKLAQLRDWGARTPNRKLYRAHLLCPDRWSESLHCRTWSARKR